MDEPRTPTVETPHLNGTDVLLVALLALLTLGLRVYQLATTEVTARDSISYIHIAWQLEHGDWLKVIPTAPQHPGYPVAVLAASVPARLLFPNDLPYAMQFAAQLVSAASSVLLVAPLYWLGRQLFNARIAFGAVLLFQCLPCSGRIMADGLSEGVFLLFAVTALATAMYALRTGSVAGFAVVGAASGLAYLTRPEGLVVPAAAGLTLVGMQLFPRWRRPWGGVLASGAAMTVAVLLIGGPFMVLIRGITNKNSGGTLIKEATAEAAPAEDVAAGPMFAVWWQGDPNDGTGRAVWGVKTLAEVLSKAFFFVFWVPALAGLICFHRRFCEVPGAVMLLVVSTALACVLYRIAARMGYLSDRHTILILTCGLPWAAAAIDGAGRWLAGRLASARPAVAGKWWADGRAWAACLLVVAAAAPLPRTLEALHGDRVGFRAAGYWLAKNVDPDKAIYDPFGWSGYYAGRYFGPDEAGDRPCEYVVIEVGANRHSHLVTVPDAKKAAETGEELKAFPAPRVAETARVVVYRLPQAWKPAGVAN